MHHCSRDLIEEEYIKKRWQEYTEELYKKDLHDPDNHDGVITHPEPDILECNIKTLGLGCNLKNDRMISVHFQGKPFNITVIQVYAPNLGSITVNKARGGGGIPAELFQILKGDAIKVLHSICLQTWKIQHWPQDWKRSVFIPIPKKGNAKKCSNYYTTTLISYTSKVMLKIL